MEKFFIKSLFLLLVVILISACSINKTWTGYYYPDRNNIGDESTWIIQSGFKNIDDCRNWIDNIAGNNQNYDYECGYDCTYRQEYKMNVCQKTEK
ncbi:MAG: hypothetical protein ACOXZ1_03685 [Patescibacteria group bacterium]|jgi:hypothetical protein